MRMNVHSHKRQHEILSNYRTGFGDLDPDRKCSMAGRLLRSFAADCAWCVRAVEKCGARSTGNKPIGQILNARRKHAISLREWHATTAGLRRRKMNFW